MVLLDGLQWLLCIGKDKALGLSRAATSRPAVVRPAVVWCAILRVPLTTAATSLKKLCIDPNTIGLILSGGSASSPGSRPALCHSSQHEQQQKFLMCKQDRPTNCGDHQRCRRWLLVACPTARCCKANMTCVRCAGVPLPHPHDLLPANFTGNGLCNQEEHPPPFGRWWRMLALLLGRADDVPGQPGPQQLVKQLPGVCNIVIASNNKDQVCRVVHSRQACLPVFPPISKTQHARPSPVASSLGGSVGAC
ncbi:hypothetical protein COO60DRAFT_1632469 [Scenedesmus sp. NREL 46B-D3]|nr:hypothetical protein COO60DRAFT_1632469 [Scenedesmus sp. NREL 46B-D3]